MNYQILWEKQNLQAYTHFPEILTETELLPYIIKNEHRHLQYKDPTSNTTTYFEQINLDKNFITEDSETSDNRPYITSNISPETTPEEQTFNVSPHYTRQNTVHFGQDHLANLLQNPEPYQLNPLYPSLQQKSDTQQPELRKQLQYKTNQNSLKKLTKLYKIHKVFWQQMIQILNKFLPTI